MRDNTQLVDAIQTIGLPMRCPAGTAERAPAAPSPGGRRSVCRVGEECVDHGRRDDDASTKAQRREFLGLHALVRGGT